MTDTAPLAQPVATRPCSPNVQETPSRFRPDIEGLRAIAVVLVVIGHAGLGLSGGYVGVDVFFVISGFLITRQLHDELRRDGRISIGRFYARRARRILPAAVVVLVATLLASWALLSPLRVRSVATDALFSALSWVNWRLAEQGVDYFGSAAPPSPLQHYWSLAVEEQFYAVWPILMVLVAALLGRVLGRERAIVGTLVAVVAMSLYLSVAVTAASAPTGYFGSHTRAWELALGALIALTVTTWARLPAGLAAATGWLGLVMIGYAAWTFSAATLYPGIAATVPVLGAALVVAAGCARPAAGPEVVLGQALMQFGGRMSYSWYLWHWPLFTITAAALARPTSVAESLGLVAVSLGLALATFHLVEQPFRARQGLVEHPQRGIGLGTASVAAAVTLALVVGSVVTVPGAGGVPPTHGRASIQGSVSTRTPVAIGDVAPEVAAATSLRTLPSVTPSLDAAPLDSANVRRCFAGYAEESPVRGDECVFGDPGATKTMFLFGDSHAAQWHGPLEDWAKRNRWRMISALKGACPPGDYPEFVVYRLHRVYTECNAWRGHTLAFIEQTKPDVVVIGSLAQVVSIGGSGMTDTVRRIEAAGSKVLFMADTPQMTFSVPDCLAQHSDDVQSCAAATSAALARPERAGEISQAEQGGATVFDATPYLCTAETCPPVISDMVVYRDDNHLTNTYARSLAGPIGEVISTMGG